MANVSKHITTLNSDTWGTDLYYDYIITKVMHHEHTPPPSTLKHTIKCYHNIQPPHTPHFFIAIKTVYHTIVSLICYCMYTNHSYCRFHSGYTIYLFNLYLTPESARKRSNAFKLEHPGDDSVNSMTKEKMRMIKDIYRERRECVNNSDESSHASRAPRTPEDDRDSHYFVSTGSSLLNLLDSVYKHSEHCAERLTCSHDKNCGRLQLKMFIRTLRFMDQFPIPTKWNVSRQHTINARITQYGPTS